MRKFTTHGLADKSIFLIIFLAAIAAALGLWLGQRFFNNSTPTMHRNAGAFASLLVYAKPKAIAPFNLKFADGKDFNLASLQGGKVTVLVFGFTTCPDICPTTLTGFKQLKAQIPEALRPNFLLVSVDPERDTPQKLSEYVRFFDPEFQAATGDIATLTSFAANLGAVFEKEAPAPGAPADSYMMAHTASIFIIGPDGQVWALIRQPFQWRQIGRDLSVFLAQAKK